MSNGSRSTHILLVGLNHRSAPIELRERLAFGREQLRGAFAKLRDELGLQEAIILSTCNRVEIYAGVHQVDGTLGRLRQFLSDHSRVELADLAERLYSYREPLSIQHLFSVASGLDSMVLGEAEILHQVKDAYERAKDCGATGKVFNVLLQRALNAAKAVRTQTGIGHGCTSVGTVAVELSQKIFGQLSGATVLLVGAGKIGELTLKRLSARGVRRLRVLNRSLDRARSLASAYGAEALPLDALPTQLLEADIVISSTSATTFLLGRREVAAAMRARYQRPLCLVDLGVPRNIEPAVGSLENVYLFDVDDLQGLVDHSYEERQEAACEAQAILDQKVNYFLSWWEDEQIADCGFRIADVKPDNPQLTIRNPKYPSVVGDD